MLTALLMVPLIAAVGAALDYAQITTARMNIERIADVAVLAAIANARNDAATLDEDQLLTATENTIAEMLEAGKAAELSSGTLTYTITADTDDDGLLTAHISYTFAIDTDFLRLIGQSTVKTSGIATARGSVKTFKNFSILVDVSSSMGIGARPSDISQLESKVGCAFACHSTIGNIRSKYPEIRVRIDAARDAMDLAVDVIEEEAHQFNSIRLGFYTMRNGYAVQHVSAMDVNKSEDYDYVRNVINNNTILKGSHAKITRSIDDLADELQEGGRGYTKEEPEQHVLIITDGSDDGVNTPGAVRASNRVSSIPASACDPLKDKNINVYIIYTRYYAANHNLSKSIQNVVHPRNLIDLPKCASSSENFYLSENITDLEEAMTDIFHKVAVPNHVAQ